MKSIINLDSLTTNQLIQLEEDDLREKVIIPLLKEIGADRVQDMHGDKEKGIDVYFEWWDVFDHRRRFGMQVKATPLVCTSRPDKNRNILTITNQIQRAFSNVIPLFDSMHGKIHVHIDGFYIVTSKTVTKEAIDYILEERKTYPYIHIIHGDLLMDVIKDIPRLKKRKDIFRTSLPFYSLKLKDFEANK